MVFATGAVESSTYWWQITIFQACHMSYRFLHALTRSKSINSPESSPCHCCLWWMSGLWYWDIILTYCPKMFLWIKKWPHAFPCQREGQLLLTWIHSNHNMNMQLHQVYSVLGIRLQTSNDYRCQLGMVKSFHPTFSWKFDYLSMLILNLNNWTILFKGARVERCLVTIGQICRGSEAKVNRYQVVMMTSSNGDIFRVTGPMCGELAAHRWIPLTKAGDSELWCFLWHAWINGCVNNRESGD